MTLNRFSIPNNEIANILKLCLNFMWKYIGIDFDWSIAVHPNDIYTFDTLNKIIKYQKNILINKNVY